MIQLTVNFSAADPEKIELRTSSVGSDTAAKPPYLVTMETVVPVLMALLRASQLPEVGSVQ